MFFIVFGHQPVTAQDYSYRHFDVKDGLVGNHVYHIVQDKQGFLWFATETGVSRFDGSRFKNFTTEDGLPDNEVVRLFADSKGRVWMAPFNNTICYYYQGKIYNEKNDTLLRNMKLSHPATHIMEDSGHNIIIIEDMGLYILPPRGGKKRLDLYLGNGIGIATGGVDYKGKPYIVATVYADNRSIYAFLEVKTDGEPQLIRRSIQGFERILGSVHKHHFLFTHQGLLFPTEESLQIKQLQNLQYLGIYDNARDTIDLPTGLNAIAYGANGQLYFNTKHGVKIYDFSAKKYIANLLVNENVSYCMDDNEGNKWFTTLGKGVYMASPDIKRIKLANANENITAINGNGQLAFVGANADNRIYKIDVTTGNLLAVGYLPWEGYGKVVDIDNTGNQFYFLSTYGLYKSDTTLKDVKAAGLNKRAYTYKDMAVIGADSFAFAVHSSSFIRSFDGLPNILFSKRSTAICHAYDGLFIGTLQGLYFIGPNRQIQYLGATEPFLANRITKLLFANNRLWVGTNAYGVVCYDGKKIIKKMSEKEGLSGNIVQALYAKGNDLWVGTDRGLNKLNMADTSLPILGRYTLANGLASDMVNAVYAAGSMVFVGTPEGLSFFDEKKVAQKSRCDLRLLGITVSGNDRTFLGQALQLSSKENNIRFEFVAISYKSAGDITYHYKLVGIDDDWKTTKDNFLLYPALPSGNYELLLQAVNKFGVRSEQIRIPFGIDKKFIEHNAFRIAIVLLAIGLAWALTSWRIRRIRKRYREKIETNTRIATLEQQALKAQMNPHFIFNCLNSIQQYVMDKDVLGANKFITGFSRLIRQTLENSSKQMISVGEEAAFLNAYLALEKLRFEGKFEYCVCVDESINKEEMMLPPMLLQPFVENSIRHGIRLMKSGIGLVNINISLTEDDLICTVLDNGVGREAAQRYKGNQHIEYQSKGMLLTSQRIALFNKNATTRIRLLVEDLRGISGEGTGTKITICIPLQK